MPKDDDQFLRIGDRLVADLVRDAGLTPSSRVLDMGCGYGHLAHALIRSDWDGQCLGFDLSSCHITRVRATSPGATRTWVPRAGLRVEWVRRGGWADPTGTPTPRRRAVPTVRLIDTAPAWPRRRTQSGGGSAYRYRPVRASVRVDATAWTSRSRTIR